MRNVILLSLTTLLPACAASQPRTESNRETTVAELKSTLAQRDERFNRWNEALPEHRQACDLLSGDCRLLVHEKRDTFIKNQNTTTCRQPDPDSEARCLIDTLIKRGTVDLALDYCKIDLWCLDRLLECLRNRQEKAESDSIDARTLSRRNDIEQSETGIAERARVSLAIEKIKYVRATLPPNAEDVCLEAQPKESCLETANSMETDFVKELTKSEQDYKRPRAAKLLDEMTAATAACYAPELECLSKQLVKYGETTETRRVLEQNYKLLEQRQRLVEKQGLAVAKPCLEQSANTHQPEIIRCYLAYVREPVLFFRRQLHRAFLALHEAQIACLKQ